MKPDCENDFAKAHEAVHRELKKMEGFLGLETMRSLSDPLLRLDRVAWSDPRTAKAAYAAFQTLAVAKAFMAKVASVAFSGHFLPLEREDE